MGQKVNNILNEISDLEGIDVQHAMQQQ